MTRHPFGGTDDGPGGTLNPDGGSGESALQSRSETRLVFSWGSAVPSAGAEERPAAKRILKKISFRGVFLFSLLDFLFF